MTVTIRGIVVGPAGSNIFNTATVHGNIKNVGRDEHGDRVDDDPPVDRPDDHQGRQPGSRVRADVAADNRPADEPAPRPTRPPGLGAACGDIPVAASLRRPVCLGGLTYTSSSATAATGTQRTSASATRCRRPDLRQLRRARPASSAASNAAQRRHLHRRRDRRGRHRDAHLQARGAAQRRHDHEHVEVDPNNAIFEPDETNNTDTRRPRSRPASTSSSGRVTTRSATPTTRTRIRPATPVPAGHSRAERGFDPIATNGTQTYTIIVDNVGTQDVTGSRSATSCPPARGSCRSMRPTGSPARTTARPWAAP